MKLLGSGFSTSETTFAGTTGGAGGAGGVAGAQPKGNLRIRKVSAFCGGSSVAPNTSGGIMLRVGQSSGAIESTFVVLPSASSNTPVALDLEGFDIYCNWFEAASNEAASGGWGIFVFGD